MVRISKINGIELAVIEAPIEVTATYTALTTDSTVIVDATAGDIIITLPTSIAGKIYTIKRRVTDVSINTVTVVGAAAELIENETSQPVSAGASMRIQAYGAGWYII